MKTFKTILIVILMTFTMTLTSCQKEDVAPTVEQENVTDTPGNWLEIKATLYNSPTSSCDSINENSTSVTLEAAGNPNYPNDFFEENDGNYSININKIDSNDAISASVNTENLDGIYYIKVKVGGEDIDNMTPGAPCEEAFQLFIISGQGAQHVHISYESLTSIE